MFTLILGRQGKTERIGYVSVNQIVGFLGWCLPCLPTVRVNTVFRSGMSTNLRSVLAAGSLAWTVDGFFGCRIPLSRSKVWGCTRRGWSRGFNLLLICHWWFGKMV